MEKLKLLYDEYKLPYEIIVKTDMLYNTPPKIVNTPPKIVNTSSTIKVFSSPDPSNFKMEIKPLRLFVYSDVFPKVLSGSIYNYIIKMKVNNGINICKEDINFCLYVYPRNYCPYIGKVMSSFKEKKNNSLIYSIRFCECSFFNDYADFRLCVFFKGKCILASTKFKIFARRREEEKKFWKKYIF